MLTMDERLTIDCSVFENMDTFSVVKYKISIGVKSHES